MLTRLITARFQAILYASDPGSGAIACPIDIFKCKEGQTCGETSCQYEEDDRVKAVHRAKSFIFEVATAVVRCKKRVGLGEYGAGRTGRSYPMEFRLEPSHSQNMSCIHEYQYHEQNNFLEIDEYREWIRRYNTARS